MRSVARLAGLDGAPTGTCGARPRRASVCSGFAQIAQTVGDLPFVDLMLPARRKVVVRRIVKKDDESTPLLDAADVDHLLDAAFAPASGVVPIADDGIEELTDGVVDGWEDDDDPA